MIDFEEIKDIKKFKVIGLLYGESHFKNSSYYKVLVDKLKFWELEIIEDIEENLNSIELLLAVGGGSVIDYAKSMSKDIKLWVIPTILGSNSENNCYISSKPADDSYKKPDRVFYIPQLLTTLQPNYLTYSIITLISREIINNINTNSTIFSPIIYEFMDIIEVILRDISNTINYERLINLSLKIHQNPINLNPIKLAIELCRLKSIPLGASLSIIIPAWLRSIDYKKIYEIEKLENWFHSQGSPIRLSEYNIEYLEVKDIDTNILTFAIED
ncbi:MAG: hypothetical protein JXR64_01780 [Spirochaetales bacterium]|nr:hypothetical protein [Spirochaetales bacterium]